MLDINWKIYYEDGSTFSNKDGPPFSAPRTGVQVIIYKEEEGYSILSQADYYYYEPERNEFGWSHCSPEGMMLQLIRAKNPLILFGSYILTRTYTEIEKQAFADIGKLKVYWRRGMDKTDPGIVAKIKME